MDREELSSSAGPASVPDRPPAGISCYLSYAADLLQIGQNPPRQRSHCRHIMASAARSQHLAVYVATVHAGYADGPGSGAKPYAGTGSGRNEHLALFAEHHAHRVWHRQAVLGAYPPGHIGVSLGGRPVSRGDGQPHHMVRPAWRLGP